MKKILLLSTLMLIGIITETAAQECYIYYNYDNGGNRYKRGYNCDGVADPEQPGVVHNPGGAVSRVYPVPTSGVFHVEFTSPVTDAYLFLSDMNGVVLLERTITQQTSITSFDISPWVPGNYILTAIVAGAMEGRLKKRKSCI
jgi:hypothetical protein